MCGLTVVPGDHWFATDVGCKAVIGCPTKTSRATSMSRKREREGGEGGEQCGDRRDHGGLKNLKKVGVEKDCGEEGVARCGDEKEKERK
jgi:hypothetical protein